MTIKSIDMVWKDYVDFKQMYIISFYAKNNDRRKWFTDNETFIFFFAKKQLNL